MTDDNKLELTRRKILGSMGAIGAAGAAAGLGTSAFFSDQETFVNNQLVAGSLDLHVGWEEHYSDWSDDEDDGLASVEMVERNTTADANRTALPLAASSPENGSMITVENVSQARRFLNNTEAMPNSSWANVSDFDPWTASGDPCTYLADAAEQSPVIIDLDDVKPGDFGEITFSFATCDNPGYVWLNGGLQSASENGYTEPEAEDPDESGDADGDGNDDRVELLDKVRAAAWYDDGDNLHSGGGSEGGSGKVDIAFVLDRSGSMGDERTFLENNITSVSNDLESAGVDAQYSLVPYEDGTSSDGSNCTTFIATDLTTDPSTLDFSYDTCGGTEDASEAIQYTLNNLSWRSDAQKVLVVLTDEDDDGDSTQRQNALDAIDNENACLLAVSNGGSQPNDLQQMASEVDCGDWVNIDDGLSQDNLDDFVSFVGGVAGGEQVFIIGTLRDVLNELSNGHGVPLNGDISAEEGGGTGAVNCFSAGTRHDIGFAWWLPVNHANEIQTDTATFKLGFYTEQCRHNAGPEQFGNA